MPTETFAVPPPNLAVAVIGDVMIDDNMFLAYTGREDVMADRASLVSAASALGGAGNVAANTAGLGLQTALVGMVGDDGNGARVTGLARSRLNVYPMLFVCDGVKTKTAATPRTLHP
jgi:D-beta-D-heptose 7-phosphate kinase/D-beta-D-heptose 1-phosphate adenosyltransferase